MRSIWIVVLVAWLALFSTGCARSPGGISASNMPLAPGGYTALGRVSADDCLIYLFGVLPISGSNYIEDAELKAIRKIPGAVALVDISVDRVSKFFILWGQVCTEVHATAVRVP
jgi:hypothetical protein